MPQAFANVELITSITVSFLVISTCAQCYLEDTSALCAVCWQNTKIDSGKECPPGVAVSLTLPKTQMYEQAKYPVSIDLKLNRNKFPIVGSKGYEIVHANVHSCITKFGACTPFVAHTPGLSTHTPAQKGNLSVANASTTSSHMGSETYDLEAKYKSQVQLAIDEYVIIAHFRFYTRDSNQVLTRWDVAAGSSRKVEEAPVEISTDSIVGAVGAGILLILFVGSCLYGVRSGKVDLGQIVGIATGPRVSLVADLVVSILDAIAVTACIIEEVFPVNSLQHIVPICVLLLVVAWLGSFYAAFTSCLYAKDQYHEHFNKKSFLQAQLSKAGSSFNLEVLGSDVSKATITHLAMQHNALLHAKLKMASNIITIFLTDLPIASLNTYLLFETGPNTFVVASLILSILLFGAKTSSTITVMKNVQTSINIALEEIEAEARMSDLMQPNTSSEMADESERVTTYVKDQKYCELDATNIEKQENKHEKYMATVHSLFSDENHEDDFVTEQHVCTEDIRSRPIQLTFGRVFL